jgi:16S rRNA G1207 methylase RsmC
VPAQEKPLQYKDFEPALKSAFGEVEEIARQGRFATTE